MEKGSTERLDQVVGLDLGDQWSQVVVVEMGDGEVIEESRVRTTSGALSKRFGNVQGMRVVLEAGTHSPWVARLFASLGHEVIVANRPPPYTRSTETCPAPPTPRSVLSTASSSSIRARPGVIRPR